MKIAVVGGGPAGLRAAEIASADSRARVTLFETKASVGRKFLVAGRGGLNLTKQEPWGQMAAHYRGPGLPEWFFPTLIREIDAATLREWASGLEVETFAAGTGRVYPKEMKAAALLRRWVKRLKAQGVVFATKHRWSGIALKEGSIALQFETEQGPVEHRFDAVVLALGGASWPDTGSDGGWMETLGQAGVAVTPLEAANCGWETAWPEEVLREAEGEPLKNIALSLETAGSTPVHGELLITRYGLEGGAIYQLGAALREARRAAGGGPVSVRIDLKAGVSAERLRERLHGVNSDWLKAAARRWRLSKAALALLGSRADEVGSAQALIELTKAFPVELHGPRPVAEAISSAGGVAWSELTPALMLHRLPGVFPAGEMIDWEAPTGGYLIQGCFAMGTLAGREALAFAASKEEVSTR